MNSKKTIISSMVAITLFTGVSPVLAAVETQKNTQSNEAENRVPVPNGNEVKRSDVNIKDIYLIDGEAYDKYGNLIVDELGRPMARGKLSWAVKAIRKGYSKVPAPIRGFINKYGGLETILGVVDHFTGAVETAIYKACKAVKMPDWMAWAVSKALTLLI
ncbi:MULTISPECIES: hypothetical protein [unclassified Lactococcus]|uniref:hypothetical protein n=1 Tax=unclassified Lactococcus TaxID=2643510 RepID=UPI0011CC6776|nr:MULTISPECIES: hypothetical protein [unclassified Lactococcus]MQW24096.1 hypothetical protein [Lactococcus sp. dk101]TXK45379.1 hypothetical protein FVP43_11485 [Lactococcus sp. dk322]